MGRRYALVFVSMLLVGGQAMAAATCGNGSQSVVINDSPTITVSGLETQGIQDGDYGCRLYKQSVDVFFAQSSEFTCRKIGDPDVVIQSWMKEGVGLMGVRWAVVALYVNNSKVFESFCSRN